MSRLVAVTAFVLLAATATTPEAAIRTEFRAAAKAGDLTRFDIALNRAHKLIETMKLGARRNEFRRAIFAAEDLSRVWHFARSDPNGMFYDEERLPFFYDHVVSHFPDYARFINDFRVVDKSGLPEYPTLETREFLLRKAENTAPASP